MRERAMSSSPYRLEILYRLAERGRDASRRCLASTVGRRERERRGVEALARDVSAIERSLTICGKADAGAAAAAAWADAYARDLGARLAETRSRRRKAEDAVAALDAAVGEQRETAAQAAHDAD